MADLGKFRRLARNWEALGDADPLFGVLSDPTKYGGKWDPQEFFASGQAHVDKLLRILSDARATFERGSCLDFGCGVGRLTVPLSRLFGRTVGVDVARPMIEAARRHLPAGMPCEFVVNRDPDLRQFPPASFDLVHSCLVLQHIPPDVSVRYIAEFLRVVKPGGLVVFQVPAEVRTESQISASHALPDGAYAAALSFTGPIPPLAPGTFAEVAVRVENRSQITWPHDIPAGRHICLGNHWLREDGSRVVDDDARAFLPHPIGPGHAAVIPIRVQAPDAPGRYVLEMDLVQEHICWFSERGSATARTPVSVDGRAEATSAVSHAAGGGPVVAPAPPPPRVPWVRRWLHRLRGAQPTFEMHVVPRAVVEATIAEGGGRLIRAVDDNAAGPGWLSYTYICRRDR